jgi:predicted RNA-binding protein with TRAM domain
MSGYVGNIPTPQATQTRNVYTATASQTTFGTTGYTPGFVDVFLNGIHLVNGSDYTASNGIEVVLTTGAAAGDDVEIVAYSTFEVANTISASAGGTITGAVTINNSLTANSLTVTGAGSFATATAATQTASATGATTLDFSTYQNFVLTLTGNVTLSNPTTETIGQTGFIVFIQDATGGRTVSLGTDYETAAAAGLTLSSTASTTDIVPYIVVASNRILLGAPQLAFA